jgi:pimeloyl-ACP methyl ester carboxylesterase
MRTVSANGIRMRIAEMGSGPLVIFLHGFPESGYSWRHHLTALAAAGFHAVAPDLRGYGETDKPTAVEDYDIHHLTADVVGLIAGHWVQQERPDETNAVLIRFLKEVATPAGVLTAR